jgi:hypothetical protein
MRWFASFKGVRAAFFRGSMASASQKPLAGPLARTVEGCNVGDTEPRIGARKPFLPPKVKGLTVPPSGMTQAANGGAPPGGA